MPAVFLAVVALLLSGTTAFAGCDYGETKIKFSHVVADSGHPKGDSARRLAERVNKEMQGRFCMEVFPNSTLYNDNKVLEAMLLGDVQLAAPSLSKFEKYTLKFRVFDLPFLFDDAEAVYRFQDSRQGQKLGQSIESKGLLMIGYWPNGMKQISAKRPLIEPSDARGLKFRVMTSEVLVAQMKALGASPQKLAFKEVYGALQTGVVDGQENTYSNIYSKKFFEVQDGITESNHGILTYGLVTSAEFWNGLKRADRNQLARIIKEVTAESRANAAKSNQKAKRNILVAGGTIRELSPAERRAWVSVMRPVWDQFSSDIGADVISAALKANK